MEPADRCGSFAGWLTALLLCSMVVPMLLPLLPLLPAAQASQLSGISASAARLDQLFDAERHIVGQLEHFVQLSERRLQHAKRYLELYRDEVSTARPSNPVRDFRLLQRVEKHWNEDLVPDQLLETLTSIRNELGRFVSAEGGPGAREAVETISAMLMVQHVYNIDIGELADGRLLGLDTGTKMAVSDIHKLAEIAINSKSFQSGLVWLETGAKVARARNETEWANRLDRRLLEAKRKHDDLLAAAVGGYELFPTAVMGRSPSAVRNEMERDVKLSEEYTRTFGALCRGRDLREAWQRAKLYCAYEKPHPYLYLQPLKTEVHSIEPYLCVYHDFLRQDEMQQLMEIAEPKMQRSVVGADGESTWSRVSTSARLEDGHHPLVAALSLRMQMVTGLDTVHRRGYPQETLQVCEYGAGGFFQWHHDFLNLEDSAVRESYLRVHPLQLEYGERIATVMIYLSSVLRGGRTVFPLLGVSLEPQPGSAVYWDNLRPDGTGDRRTLHAGCPVAFGYKWSTSASDPRCKQVHQVHCADIQKTVPED
ncbi:prolyl 4-hydroxylase subunit alpha-1-like [Pollicipes pollicipes]|uniref:prolyl 4-hydroxylase subunit alpha-1-like n=1 Tax=Pollicipes pollicipes TaxID=41117 RepID=UPI0018849A35|nr:prolyl 4-hydroxylase subunit alpha-1-like [Pollicipes pollicipes]